MEACRVLPTWRRGDRRASARVAASVDKRIAERQAASHYPHDLAGPGVLREMPVGNEKLFIHTKLMLCWAATRAVANAKGPALACGALQFWLPDLGSNQGPTD